MYSSEYLIIDSRGAIIRQGTCSVESLALQAGAGELLRAAEPGISDATHFWDYMSETWRTYPARPGPWAEFDFLAREWIDPRTTEDLAADLAEAQLRAVAKINADAATVRRRYVTEIPGQEALYMMKEAEARAWVASADPDPALFPLISAEIGITGTDADQVAQVYLNLAGIYVQAAAQLETARLGHIAQAEAADTPEAAAAIAEAFRELIGQLPV